jgi:hypothetical protein
MPLNTVFSHPFVQFDGFSPQIVLFKRADKRYFRAGQLMTQSDFGRAHSPLTAYGRATFHRTDTQKDAANAA